MNITLKPHPTEMFINDEYYEICIDDATAKSILETYIHETLHFNKNWFSTVILCNFNAGHDTVYKWAKILADRFFEEYNKKRLMHPEYQPGGKCHKC